MSGDRTEIGYVHEPAKKRTRPKTDREVLEALGPERWYGTHETHDDLAPWTATVVRRSGTAVCFCRGSEAAALSEARRFVDAGGLDE